jgi:thioredoxin 1
MKQWMLGLVGVLALSTAIAMTKNYVEYAQKAYDDAASMKRVLFFAASWCPTCRGADKDFNANLDKIPGDVIIFKTDYDTQTALKTKYGITHQHTFVYVNAKGEALKKWSGGATAEVIENTK